MTHVHYSNGYSLRITAVLDFLHNACHTLRAIEFNCTVAQQRCCARALITVDCAVAQQHCIARSYQQHLVAWCWHVATPEY
jgi:hypothetical protein